MSSLRKSKGNMYTWLTHTWSPIRGCAHQCTYCYVRRYKELPEVPVLDEKDFPDLGKGRSIFVGHFCDMFSAATPAAYVLKVLNHCCQYDNEYIFQTKHLAGLTPFLAYLPPRVMIGTTVETNRAQVIASISKAPPPAERTQLLATLASKNYRTFLTVEPILDFDVNEFAQMIAAARPCFVNIGADSKGHDLPEPSKEKLLEFIAALNANNVQIRKKINLERILDTPEGKT